MVSFGIINVFEDLGYLIAPFVGSLIIVAIGAANILPGWIFAFLLIAFIFYLFLCMGKMTQMAARAQAARGGELPAGCEALGAGMAAGAKTVGGGGKNKKKKGGRVTPPKQR